MSNPSETHIQAPQGNNINNVVPQAPQDDTMHHDAPQGNNTVPQASQDNNIVPEASPPQDNNARQESTLQLFPPEYLADYPLLFKLNYNCLDCSDTFEGRNAHNTMDNMLREIIKFKEKHNEQITYESSNSRYKYKLVKIPCSSDSSTFYSNATKLAWIDEILSASVEDDEVEDAIHCFIDYLSTKYGDTVRDHFRNLGLIPKQMDEFEVAATIDKCNLGIAQWRNLVQCLKTFLELENFCISEKNWQKLGEDHGKISTGTFVYEHTPGKRPEKCTWWTMDPADEFISKLVGLLNGKADFDPKNIECIQMAFGGDHGKGKFRFVAKLIITMKSKENLIAIYPLGDIKCKKDNGVVLKNSILANLRNGIHKIEDGKVEFYFDAETNKW